MVQMVKYPTFLTFLVLIMVDVCYQQKLGDRQTVQGCYMRAEAGWSGLCDQNSDSTSCLHNPSHCGWVIVTYEPIITSQTAGSYSASLISGQAEFAIITITQVENHYDALISAAAKLGLFNFQAKLETEKREKISEYSSFYNNGAQTLSAEAKTTAQGWCLDRKRGWIELHFSVVEEFVGCTVSDLTKELESDPDFKANFTSVQHILQDEVISTILTPTPTLP